MNKITQPIIENSKAYAAAFDHLNRELFGGTLAPPMLILSRNKNIIGGYFAPERWVSEEGAITHEIAINANIMVENDFLQVMNTLAHEMVHLWQYELGKDIPRYGYHNREWSDKALEIGLLPKDLKTHKETGQSISTEVDMKGPLAAAIGTMPDEAIFPWTSPQSVNVDPQEPGSGGKTVVPQDPPSRSGSRAKYTCHICGLNAWAKAGAKLICGDCEDRMIEVGG
jgi:hypothetical protein